MSKNGFIALGVIIGCILLIGCAAQKPPVTFTPYDFSPELNSGRFVSKVDNALILLDASGSMQDKYKGQVKLDFAKSVVSRMNRTMAPLTLNAGLRTFGGSISPFGKITRLIYGITEYDEANFETALQTVKRAGGSSPLFMAVDAAGSDLKSVQGDTAVIVVSDGKEMDDTPVMSAKKLKDRFGDKLCIFSILVGTDPGGKALMEQIVRAGQCGFSVAADEILSGENMADFVKKVFLSKQEILDSDGDGVNDDQDGCPDTPVLATVDARGCPLDSDGDGVYDYLDQCAGTPYGVTVGKWGCRLDSDRDGVYDDDDFCPDTPYGARVNDKGCWTLEGILFDTGRWDVKPQMSPILDEVVAVLLRHPDLGVEVQGHTDSRGDAAYNKKLSENRAKAVMKYFIKEGIDPRRLSAVGLGENRPIASNDTPEGRAMNRRVQLKPVY